MLQSGKPEWQALLTNAKQHWKRGSWSGEIKKCCHVSSWGKQQLSQQLSMIVENYLRKLHLWHVSISSETKKQLLSFKWNFARYSETRCVCFNIQRIYQKWNILASFTNSSSFSSQSECQHSQQQNAISTRAPVSFDINTLSKTHEDRIISYHAPISQNYEIEGNFRKDLDSNESK